MKKSILFVAALFAAFTLNAKEIVVDLSAATELAYDACSGTPTLADGVLTVDYMTPAGWLWAGVEMPVNNLTNVTNVSFEYKGSGEGVVLYAILIDSEGNRWTKGDLWPSLEETDWTLIEMLPDTKHWDSPEYSFGEKPFVKIGFIANPGTATTSTFWLRNVKIVADEATAIETVAAQQNATKIMRNGQVLIVRDGKTFDMLGAEVK